MQIYKEAILDLETPFPPLYGDVIIIPANTYFYRGYSTKYPVLGSRPAYFGSAETASGYSSASNTELGAFKTTRDLYLLDYRFMKVILKQLFEEITKDSKLTKLEAELVRLTILSFGISSLEHQIRLLNNFPKEYIDGSPGFKYLIESYKGPSLIEQPGIRVAETTNDSFTMGFLQGLFYRKFHGFISPRLKSVFHYEKGGTLSPEIIVFNPADSGIEQTHFPPVTIPRISVRDLILKTHPRVTISIRDRVSTEFFMRGGSSSSDSKRHVLDDIEENIQKKNKNIINNYNRGMRIGEKWQEKGINVSYSIPPHPHIKGVSIINNNRSGALEII